MLGSFLILLREGFEATLLIAIVLAYLAQIDRRQDFRQVWIGVGAAVGVSVVVGAVLFLVADGLGGTAGALFKVATMWIAVAFLTYMVLWMKRQSRTIAKDIRSGVDRAVAGGSAFAISVLVFVMVFREGLETALFMFGITQTSSPVGVAVGGLLGLIGAVGLGYAVYVGGKRINLGTFFKVTGALLILVAAGLLARSVAILEIEGMIPAVLYPLWDVTNVYALTTESTLGQFLTAFTGWDAKPDLLEFFAWFAYVVGVGTFFLKPPRTKQTVPQAKQVEA